MIQQDLATVKHILRQASDHSMLLLDTNPLRQKTKGNFIFYAKWIKEQESEDIVKEVWKRPVEGSRMYKVQKRWKWCKLSFIQWRKKQTGNARVEIEIIQEEIETMQRMKGQRDWGKWNQLKASLNEAYKAEEEFWKKKSRVG